MKKIIVLMISLFLYSCATLDSIEKSTSNFLEPIPQNIKIEAESKVNPETEFYGIGVAPIAESGVSFALSKATVDAKNNLKDTVIKESEAIYNSFLAGTEAYMKKIYTPVIPDLTDYAIEKMVPKLSEKGNWNDGKNAYVLVTVQRSEVLQESKNALMKYTTLLEEELLKVKSSIEGFTAPTNVSKSENFQNNAEKNPEELNAENGEESVKNAEETSADASEI